MQDTISSSRKMKPHRTSPAAMAYKDQLITPPCTASSVGGAEGG